MTMTNNSFNPKMKYHGLGEQLVEIITTRTGTGTNKHFIRLLTSFYFCKVASSLQVKVATPNNGVMPVNMYLFNFAPSGYSKGHSKFILENIIFKGFNQRFRKLQQNHAKTNLLKIVKNMPDISLEDLYTEYRELGPYLKSFDSGTLPALKQMIQLVKLSGTGCLTFEADELGFSLTEHSDLLKAFLELWDVGLIGDKLLKVTKDSKRYTPVQKAVPANLLGYGSLNKVFDGGKTESLMYSLITSGFARRSFFGVSFVANSVSTKSPEDRWKQAIANNDTKKYRGIFKKLSRLATKRNIGKTIVMGKDVGIELFRYIEFNEKRAALLPQHEEEQVASLIHAHIKVMKLAASYAFIDGKSEIKMSHLYAAIRLAEDSYQMFAKYVMTKQPLHVKLAKYIVEKNTDLTHADLAILPFYPRVKAQKNDMMQMAQAWGYRKGITITMTTRSGIDFFHGYQMTKTNDNYIVSFSDDVAKNYRSVIYSLKDFKTFLDSVGMNWINHHTTNGKRTKKACIKGFNIIPIDIDGNVHIETVQLLMEDYEYVICETKRSTKKHPRFRLIMFTNYIMELSDKKYAAFMSKIFEWLPFDVDMQTGQRNRKWLTNNTSPLIYHKGNKVNVFPFIPETQEYVTRTNFNKSVSSMPDLERWYMSKWQANKNRSNILIRYSYVLVEQGFSEKKIKKRIISFNESSNSPLSTSELRSTVFVTLKKEIAKYGKKAKKQKSKKAKKFL